MEIEITPQEIEKTSFSIIESEVPEPRPFQGDEWLIVRRMIHTSADFEMLESVKFHPEAIATGIAALKQGCLILTDTEMVRSGISPRRISSLNCIVECCINHPEVWIRAKQEGITRAAAAVDHVLGRLNGAVYAIGNAPTALLRLMAHVGLDRCRPALIVGMPVGFVNAAESKDLLMSSSEIPYITIRGRKGGSALAASVVNQLAEIAVGI